MGGTGTRIKGDDKIRIVCLTSNGYINCIEPFAHYWNKFAGEDKDVSIACYDVQPQGLPNNFAVRSIGYQAVYTWSEGLLRICGDLEAHDESVFLLMLEDYFLSAPIDWAIVDWLYTLMRRDPAVAKIDLTDDRLKVPHRRLSAGYEGMQLVVSTPNAPFTTSLQAALWRTSFLREFLDASENAWQFEKNGTKRVFSAWQSGKFDGVILGTTCPPMRYANAVGGAGGKPGVLEAKRMPAWMWDECVAKGWAKP